jgi:hypothetical protein
MAGDMEIVMDKQALSKISEKVGPVYVLYEGDGSLIKFTPDIEYVRSRAQVTIETGRISYSKAFRERVKEQKGGKK